MPSQNNKKIFNTSFSSDRKQIRSIVEDIVNRIMNSGIRLSIKEEEFLLAVDEAVTNAMEHGNKWNPSGKIDVSAEVENNRLLVSITDEGDGFNHIDLQKKLPKRDKLSNRGRGLVIISRLCDLHWNQKGNQLTLEVKLAV